MNNTTHNDSSLSRFNKATLLATKESLRLVNVIGDGACMLHAVSYVISGDENMHLTLYKDTIIYMSEHANGFQEFSEIDPDKNLPFDNYL